MSLVVLLPGYYQYEPISIAAIRNLPYHLSPVFKNPENDGPIRVVYLICGFKFKSSGCRVQGPGFRV